MCIYFLVAHCLSCFLFSLKNDQRRGRAFISKTMVGTYVSVRVFVHLVYIINAMGFERLLRRFHRSLDQRNHVRAQTT